MFPKPAAEKHNVPALQRIAGVNPAALRRYFVPHLAIFRANTANRSGTHHAIAVADSRPPYRLKARIFHERGIRLHHLDVRFFQLHFLAGALSARLLAGLLWPADHDTLPERIEAVYQNRTKAVA